MPAIIAFPESWVQSLWSSLAFDRSGLHTACGLPLRILHPGTLNRNQGPDFLDARLLIDGIEWRGNVEVHVESGGWERHRHHLDPGYNSVILHVVWESSGRPALRADGVPVPELALAPRCGGLRQDRMAALHASPQPVPCAGMLQDIPALISLNWIERLAAGRIEEKGEALALSSAGWDETLWSALLPLMGGPVNGPSFRELAGRVPFSLLRKYVSDRLAFEALLYGGAGWLPGPGDAEPYPQSLRERWDHLSHKHRMPPRAPLPLFLHRMRPGAFPGPRLSQAAGLAFACGSLLRLLSPEGVRWLLESDILADPYWERHHRFGAASARSHQRMGESQKNILIVNAIAPLAARWCAQHRREGAGAWVSELLAALPPEDNRRTRLYEGLGLPHENAFHSQGLMHLEKHYCNPRRCLDCALGRRLLNKP